MIKNYLQLSKFEVEKVVEFINRNEENKLSFEDIDKQFKSEKYDFGKGVILKISGEDIEAKALIILTECNIKAIAYVVKLDINEVVQNKKIVAMDLIKEVKNKSKEYGAQEIFLGTNDHKIITILNSLNLKKKYSAIKMTLDDRKIRCSPLNLVALSQGNKNEYLEIYNNAFNEATNGQTLTDDELNENIKKANENNCYYIAELNNIGIGFLQFNIENGAGEFDLGLIKAARGKEYGKQLLETAINFLNSKKITQINLIVITKNTLAYDMYKKRGFRETGLVSDWFELEL